MSFFHYSLLRVNSKYPQKKQKNIDQMFFSIQFQPVHDVRNGLIIILIGEVSEMKKLIIVAVSCLALCTACSSSDASEPQSVETETETIEITETAEPAQTPETVYAKDKVINDFIKTFNETKDYTFEDISETSRKTHYTAYLDGYFIDLENLSEKLRVNINETNDNYEADVNGMRDIFIDVVSVMDTSISNDEITSFIDGIISGTSNALDVQLGTLTVSVYKNQMLSNGLSRGHIQIQQN